MWIGWLLSSPAWKAILTVTFKVACVPATKRAYVNVGSKRWGVEGGRSGGVEAAEPLFWGPPKKCHLHGAFWVVGRGSALF